MDHLTEKLVDFAVNTRFDDLPEEVNHETKRLILDSIGCGIGALRMNRGKICAELAKNLGGPKDSTILGTSERVSCTNAAFANGELMNTLDYDSFFGIHTATYVIPSPMALAEKFSSTGKELILAVAIGNEVARRLQLATPPEIMPIEDGPEKGKIAFPPVSGHGTAVFGAAAAAGIMLHLNTEKMANAVGIAGYAGPPSTFRKWIATSPCRMTKYGPPGFTAEVGVRSALLADLGYLGDTEIFDGEYGYWRFTGHHDWNKEVVLEDIGKKWYCREISYKKYPSGH